jgi:hypothetical protein
MHRLVHVALRTRVADGRWIKALENMVPTSLQRQSLCNIDIRSLVDLLAMRSS